MADKKQEINFADAPPEVWEVLVIQWAYENNRMGVGLAMYQKCMETIKKYPQWFPEENKALDKIKNEQQ